MKSAGFLVGIWCLAFLVISMDPAWGMGRKKALLVGVGEYAFPPYSERPLHASFGLDLMAATLAEAGFGMDDMRFLRDRHASFRDIEQAVQRFVEELDGGSQAVLYLYGHGVLVADDNGDEEDGYDEAFVPYDGQWRSRDRHSGLIRDDMLGDWVEAMRRKVGPEGFVLVLLDACHSGSSLRGKAGGRNDVSRQGLHTSPPNSDAAPMAVLYSSLPHQPSIEIRVDHGRRCALMTWSFTRAMQESGPGSTWRAVFERTASHMTSRTRKQIPVWEGETDHVVFGRKLKRPPPYFRILGVIDSQTVLVDGGRLHGLAMGSELHFFPSDTRDTQRVAPIATGRVSGYCGIVESMVQLSQPIPEQNTLWVFPAAGASAAYPVPVHYSGRPFGFHNSIAASMEDISGVEWLDSLKARLYITKGKGLLRLTDRDRGTLMEWSDKQYREEEQMRLLRGRILRWQIARFLASWENSDETMQVSLLANKGDAAVVEMDDFKDRALAMEADILQVRVRNSGAKPIYYSLVDIDPDDEVSVLIPSQGRMPEEFRVLPGAESRTHRIRFDKRGLQVLKLMASTVPVKLEASIGTRGLPQDRPLDAAFPEGTRLRLQDLPLGNSGSFHTATLELIIE